MAGESPCSGTATTQSTYNVEVALNVSTGFDNTVLIDTGTQFGQLSVFSASAYVTFGESFLPSGGNQYLNLVTVGTQYAIPIIVNVWGGPQPTTYATLNWYLRDDYQVVLCAGSCTVAISIAEAPVTVCPLSVSTDLIAAYDLHPSDEGAFVARIAFDRLPSAIDNFDIIFALPTGESVVEFDNQDAIAGISWNLSLQGSNPSQIIASVDSGVLTDRFIDVKLIYTIPTDVNVATLSSNLYADITFIDPTFVCTQLSWDIYLSVILTSTSGGYETIAHVETGVQCETANVYDNSLYGADTNHDLADFSEYRKIIVTNSKGDVTTLASVAPYDELIEPASGNILMYPVAVGEGGVYTIKLISVPTYATGGSYNQGDTVYLNGLFYVSLQNTNTTAPLTGVAWEDYWVLTEEADLPAAYTYTKYYVQWCDIATCKAELQRSAFCKTSNLCMNDICKNACFVALLKLEVTERMLVEAETQQWYDRMIELYNSLNLLCDCSEPCK